MKKEQLKDLSVQELADRCNELRKELVTVRLNMATGQGKDTSALGKLRKQIARIETFVRQKSAQS